MHSCEHFCYCVTDGMDLDGVDFDCENKAEWNYEIFKTSAVTFM